MGLLYLAFELFPSEQAEWEFSSAYMVWLPTQRPAHLKLEQKAGWGRGVKAAGLVGDGLLRCNPQARGLLRTPAPMEEEVRTASQSLRLQELMWFPLWCYLSLCPGISAELDAHSTSLELLTAGGVSHAVFQQT